MRIRLIRSFIILSLLTTGLSAVVRAAPISTPVFSVASGDVTQTSVVLWAHSPNRGDITFEYATNADLSGVLGAHTATITDPLVPARIELSGLTPGVRYYFRAVDSVGQAAAGTFRMPAAQGVHSGLRFGVTGDWQQRLAPYPAVKNVAARQLDFFVLLGDTIYADQPSPDVPQHALTLEQYRAKHHESYSLRYDMNAWIEARASTALYAMIDDHEVINDFAGGAAPGTDPRFDQNGKFINETARYRRGLQAFHDYMPIRFETYGETGDPRLTGKPKLYRFRTFGSDAALFLLDARSFRDAPLDPFPFGELSDPERRRAYLAQTYTPGRTMLGQAQLDLLKQDLLTAQADGITWKFVLNPEPIQNFGVLNARDRFEGYAVERAELLDFITTNGIRNVVFIAADFHVMMVNNLFYRKSAEASQIKTDMWEIVTGPAAVDQPFGPSAIELGVQTGVISPQQKALYNALPMAARDELVKTLINVQLASQRYDPLGLEGSGIDATVLKGGYAATQVYGWTEFEIDAETQTLLVTTYGIPWYSQAQLEANPERIKALTPQIISQFRVKPGKTL
jgi:phosphodiesterase/alkaline phosphatase D-like protein